VFFHEGKDAMIFTTVEKVLIAFGENQVRAILDVEEGADLNTNQTLRDAIDRANALAASYLRRSVPLPLPGDPTSRDFFPDLCGHVANLVRWYILEPRPDIPAETDRMRQKDAIQFLEDVASGKVRLLEEEQAEGSTPGYRHPGSARIGSKSCKSRWIDDLEGY
jgi:phage gp36-like protein